MKSGLGGSQEKNREGVIDSERSQFKPFCHVSQGADRRIGTGAMQEAKKTVFIAKKNMVFFAASTVFGKTTAQGAPLTVVLLPTTTVFGKKTTVVSKKTVVVEGKTTVVGKKTTVFNKKKVVVNKTTTVAGTKTTFFITKTTASTNPYLESTLKSL